MFKLKDVPELKKLVTFIPNKKEPIHNWYYFKEGFSKQLVDILLEKFKLDKNSVVLDQFCGVGTTLLACKQNGYRSIGFDISPFFVFVSRVKTRDYDINKLKEFVSMALKWKFERPRELIKDDWIVKSFSRYALEDLVFYLNKINEACKDNEKERDFLLLGLIDSAMRSSYIVKDGAIIKIVKRGTPPLKKFFKYKIRKMYKDLKRLNLKPIETRVEYGDARNLEPFLDAESVDSVITSPPYLNKIEYTNIYRIEESILGLPLTGLRSFIGARVENIDVSDLGLDQNLPPVAKAYFKDMYSSLKEMHRVCKDNAKLAIIIGGGCFPDRVVESDTITAGIAEKIGFNVKNILVTRHSWCTRARTIKVGKIRESIILLEK